jgi:subtilisin family serine protease
MWNIDRVRAPEEWNNAQAGPNTGYPTVYVGVADTGLDYTHAELAGKVSTIADFTYLEEPWLICKTLLGTGISDADLAAAGGTGSNNDFNGHGTWIGGNISANMDGVGINGVAPNIKLVSLKISQWCGSAFDSEILAAFVTGADMGLDVISISFGGYTNRRDPLQNQTWLQYGRVVQYAKTKGTAIVAAAGNDHVRIGPAGLVTSKGILTAPGSAVQNLYGYYETPAGIPGVVMV